MPKAKAKAKAKASAEYWILAQTWNRNIMYGPYTSHQEAVDARQARVNHITTYGQLGGPIRLTILKAMSKVRVVKRAGNKIKVEGYDNA